MRKDWRFFIKSQYKARVPILANDTIQHCTRNTRSIKEKQKISKVIQIGKEELNCSHFANEMVLHIETSDKPQKYFTTNQ